MSEEPYQEPVSKFNPLQYRAEKRRHWSWDESKVVRPQKKAKPVTTKEKVAKAKLKAQAETGISEAQWAALMAL